MAKDDKKGNSNYARKKRWLASHEEYDWGFQVPEPKPWKQKAKDK